MSQEVQEISREDNKRKVPGNTPTSLSKRPRKSEGSKGCAKYIVNGRCTYEDNKGVKCGQECAIITNAARHFSRRHSKWMEEEATKKAKTQLNNPLKFAVVEKKSRPLRILTQLVATSTMPLNFTNNDLFKKLLSFIPNFTVPSSYQLNKLMKEELDEMLKVLIQLIKKSPGLSISADIGTTRNNRLSFLLLMVHVFDIKAGRPLTYALDIMHLRERHTGEYIARCIRNCLEKQGLCTDMVSFFVTDQGSNMMLAVKNIAQEDALAQQLALEFEIDGDEEDAEVEETVVCYNAGQLNEEDEADDVDDAVEDADDLFNSLRHIKCSAHRLQNSVKNVFEKKGSESRVFKKKMFDLVSRFHHSHLATMKLAEKTKLALVLPSATRWNYIAMVFNRLLEIRREFNEVCFELDWRYADGTPMRITEADAEAMNVFIAMLGPIWRFTIRLQEEASPTLSLLLPGLNSMLAEFEYADRFGEEVDIQSGANEDVSYDGADEDLFGTCGTSVSWMNAPSPSSLAAEVLLHLDKARLWKLGKKGSTWQYWIYHASTLPRLTKLAFDLLVIPATSQAPERGFSRLSINSGGVKGCSLEDLLRRKVLLGFNSDLMNV